MPHDPLLAIAGLTVRFPTRFGDVEAVSDVSFHANPGERIAIVGESGCGKSVTALSIMGLLGDGYVAGGTVRFQGTDLISLDDEEMRRVRGDKVAMIFQDPMTSLHPLFTIGDQLIEALRAHRRISRSDARRRAIRLLDDVLIPDPEHAMRKYPHLLSGGQRQRVMIAMALSCAPSLLIADEPTTALDVTVEAEIMQLIRRLGEERGAALLLVTHDMGVVAESADRVIVMYAGRVVEQGDVAQILQSPRHPYTAALIESIPRPTIRRKEPLPSIPGTVPSLFETPAGCRFHTRCPHAWDLCRAEEPQLFPLSAGTESRCWLHDSAAQARVESVGTGHGAKREGG